jgi:seryl-tRNA synthetase
MLDIELIKKEPAQIKKGAKLKGYNADKLVDDVIKLDIQRKKLIIEVEKFRAERNDLANGLKGKPDKKIIDKVKKLKDGMAEKEILLKETEREINKKILAIPNLPLKDVLVGKSDKENKPIKNIGKPKKFKFKIKDHAELGKDLNLIDIERGVKVGGTRSYILKNELVILEQSLLRYALDIVRKNGFETMNVPVLVKGNALVGAGFFPFGREDIYEVNEKDQFLVGTSEASLVYYYSGEIIREEELPKKLSGITTCFRKEAGTYGKDTQGVIRVHQFNKVEQVVLCTEKNWQDMFKLILGISEEIVKSLGLAYRQVEICTGDLGAKNAKQIDLEVWFPSQNKYRETHSCSYLTDYQGRRSSIKYKDKEGQKHFVHTLNNTAIATPRILAAILETYQNEDGTISVPEILQKYAGFKLIK